MRWEVGGGCGELELLQEIFPTELALTERYVLLTTSGAGRFVCSNPSLLLSRYLGVQLH